MCCLQRIPYASEGKEGGQEKERGGREVNKEKGAAALIN